MRVPAAGEPGSEGPPEGLSITTVSSPSISPREPDPAPGKKQAGQDGPVKPAGKALPHCTQRAASGASGASEEPGADIGGGGNTDAGK